MTPQDNQDAEINTEARGEEERPLALLLSGKKGVVFGVLECY